MAEYLRTRGIAEKQIHLENRARCTKQNLLFSSDLIQELKTEVKSEGDASPPFRIGVVTSGFHVRRTKLLAEEIGAFAGNSVDYFPAYGPATHIDRWFDDPEGRRIVLKELRKTLIAEKMSK
jgi:hypothetical protein